MIFLIPKKNSHISGRRNWREKIRRFTEDPLNYLREYFRRNTSGSGFSSDKRATGGLIYQRRKDRKETSGFCGGLLSQYRHLQIYFNEDCDLVPNGTECQENFPQDVAGIY